MAASTLLWGHSGLLSTNSKERGAIGAMRSGISLMVKKQPAVRKVFLSKRATISCSTGQSSSVAVASGLSDKEAILRQARKLFCEEVAFRKADKDISLAKAMLLISAEDEAYISVNREKDRLAAHSEGREVPEARVDDCGACLDVLPLAGKTISTWLSRFDFLSREVMTILAAKESYPKPLQVLTAVNTVLFEIQGFQRSLGTLDPRNSYLHLVMTLGSGSAVMLSIIYMEVCWRLGITMVGAAVGEEVLIWPLVENMQEFFEASDGGKSWFSEVNSTAIQHNSPVLDSGMEGFVHGSSARSAPTLMIASKRDLVGMALSNLKNLHWKQACKARPGFALTDPLHPLLYANGRLVDRSELAVGALLRPQDLRLAIMASERLLLLQPHNWALRRDHGLLLYHSRRYGEAVQELSICMAFAPTPEAQILEHFVEKLHLLRVESSWNSLLPPNTPTLT